MSVNLDVLKKRAKEKRGSGPPYYDPWTFVLALIEQVEAAEEKADELEKIVVELGGVGALPVGPWRPTTKAQHPTGDTEP